MTKGKFIALEGGEGMGKSTQGRLLAEALREKGLEVELTREPGGTSGAEAIRSLLLNPPGEGWGPQAEALLFAAARSDHVARLIVPAIERGAWVVCDRFLDSSRAYQGAAGELGDDQIRQLHTVGSGGLLPDLTLVIDAHPEEVGQRLRQRDGETSDAIGGRSDDYHAAVNRAFLDFASDEPGRFAVVDGSGTVEEVHSRVMAAIEPLLGRQPG
ncbi:dTMP kinase [Qipengyuania gelatinilytica]|uniref:Thymidylate kinase n=1 Tax=Qipengyuania gelatinilytica TaxID=2867231 RepID=A0ABX9A2C5_9SPHN|nr:dTMP kinase [Qipengyuania gelatinilytica]QZD95426.1 dTMP kinase [Qipengyuania gelatinilytica]